MLSYSYVALSGVVVRINYLNIYYRITVTLYFVVGNYERYIFSRQERYIIYIYIVQELGTNIIMINNINYLSHFITIPSNTGRFYRKQM